jgi:hypothetical protein
MSCSTSSNSDENNKYIILALNMFAIGMRTLGSYAIFTLKLNLIYFIYYKRSIIHIVRCTKYEITISPTNLSLLTQFGKTHQIGFL